MNAIRKPAVAGRFYPGEPNELGDQVQRYLDAVIVKSPVVPKAIIAPHAGFIYSGPVAASAYARLSPAREKISRVILLGPCHRVAVRGLALSSADAFATPLGDVPVDKDAAGKIIAMPQVQVFDATHQMEHSLEVHLPFLQKVLSDFSVVPLVVGEATPESIAEVLDVLWGGEETVIVISSDLSHYLDYKSAQKIDQATCQAIENLDPGAIAREGACGRFPVGGLLAVAKRRGMSVETLDLRNSGDTAGPKDRVVGYGSWAFTEPAGRKPTAKVTWTKTPSRKAGGDGSNDINEARFEEATRELLQKHGTELVLLAAASIDHGLAHGKALPLDAANQPAGLMAQGACFVTLKRGGQLRGCIGSSEAHRALAIDVVENAYRSAFADPRFPKLKPEERDDLDLSISVLSPKSVMSFTDEADFMRQLRPGIDGLVIADGPRRALFLPSVWTQLPDPAQFVGRLKQKAGLTADHWSKSFQAWRFVAEEIAARDIEGSTKTKSSD